MLYVSAGYITFTMSVAPLTRIVVTRDSKKVLGKCEIKQLETSFLVC